MWGRLATCGGLAIRLSAKSMVANLPNSLPLLQLERLIKNRLRFAEAMDVLKLRFD
jgi:hypothetical protein